MINMPLEYTAIRPITVSPNIMLSWINPTNQRHVDYSTYIYWHYLPCDYLKFPKFLSPTGRTIWSILKWWGTALSVTVVNWDTFKHFVCWKRRLMAKFNLSYGDCACAGVGNVVYLINKETNQQWGRNSKAETFHFMFVSHFTRIFTENSLPSLCNTSLLYIHNVSLFVAIRFLIRSLSGRRKY